MDRREFLTKAGLVLLGGTAILIEGCGGSTNKLLEESADENISADSVLRTASVIDIENDQLPDILVADNMAVTLLTTIIVGVAFGSGTPKSVRVNAGQTVLEAIKKAYSYVKNTSSTTIGGKTGNWIYTVNGYLPTGIGSYAGNLKLTKSSVIRLYKL